MAGVDTGRWSRLIDEISVTRATVNGLRERLDQPQQRQLRLSSEIDRAQARRRERVGAELPEEATLEQVRAQAPQTIRDFHRRPSTVDDDVAILELRRQNHH